MVGVWVCVTLALALALTLTLTLTLTPRARTLSNGCVASQYGMTALMFAARYGRTPVVAALMERGAELDLQNTVAGDVWRHARPQPIPST